MLDKVINKPSVRQAQKMKVLHTNTVPTKSPKRKTIQIVLSALLVLAVAAPCIYFFIAKKEDPSLKDRALPVKVATANIQDVPISIRTIGNVLPYSVVNITPQVSGQLKKVYFTQGQYVKRDDLLFQIDPGPYQAALAQAEGNVARDKAQIEQFQANAEKDRAQVGQLQANLTRDQAQKKYASVELSRYNLLQSEGAVSKEQLDQTSTNSLTADATEIADKKAIENAEAVVRSDLAAIRTARGTLSADLAIADNARIQLGWTQIRSPIDGRTGSLNVYEGNVVSANTNTPLVIIDQVQPIYVTFTVPEQYLDEVRKHLGNNSLTVNALLEGKKKNAVLGQVSFLENSVNTSTGTVVLRAAFANKELRLFPGQFVDVIVSMPADDKAVIVPASALQTTQQGTAVYVVKADGTVEFTPIELSRTTGDLAAISKGINVGDTVVTDGQLQLLPGAKVKIVNDSH